MHLGRHFMIIIVDHVGKNAGNNYYSDGMASSLREAGYECVVFSNYISQFSKKVFFGSGLTGFLLGAMFLVFHLTLWLRRRPTIIFHCFNGNLKVFLLARLLSFFSKKLICIAHDPKSIISSNDSYKENIFRLSKSICVHNDYSKAVLLNLFPKITDTSVFVISHGVDLSRFNKIDKNLARSSLGISNEKFVLLFFGQVKSSKNLELVLKSLNQITHLNPLILVYGKFVEDDVSHYLSLIPDAYRKFVKIVPGFVSDDLMVNLFSASDASLLPYKQIFQSGVLLTSFAFRLPIICSNIPGFTHMVTHSYNGFLFESDDSVAFSEACIEAYNSDMDLISDNCFRELEERFSWDLSVQNLICNNIL